MKKKNLFSRMILLLALIVGTSSAWATDRTIEIAYSSGMTDDITGTSFSNSYNIHRWTVTSSDQSTVIYVGGTVGIQSSTFAIKNTASHMIGNIDPSYDSGENYTIPSGAVGAIPGKIKKIEVDFLNSTSSGRGIYINVGTTQVVGNSGIQTGAVTSSKLSNTSGASVSQEYDVTQTSYCYFAITGGNSYYTGVKKITITYEESTDPGDTRDDCDIELDETSLELDVYDNPKAQLTATSSSTGTITWASSDETVATVSNGFVTALKAGTAKITASQEGDDNYKPGAAECTVTVTDSTPFEGGDVTFTAGTDVGSTSGNNSPDEMTKSGVTISSTDAAFATAQYRLYSGSTTTISTSNGKISKIVFTMNGSYSASLLSTTTGSYSNGTWTGSAESVAFEASAQARVDKIVVTVDMSTKAEPNFSFGETTSFTVNPNAEFTAPTLTYAQGFDGTIVYASSDEDVALVDEQTGEVVIGSIEGTATITATSAATDNFYAGSASYTINVVDSREEAGLAWSAAKVDIDKDATSYTLPTLTNDNNLTVTYSSNNEDIAVVDENTGETVVVTSALGTATITATFAGNATYKPGTASYIINIVDPNANDGSIDKPYTVADIIAGVSNTSGIYVKGFIVGSWNNNHFDLDNLVNTNLALADTPDVTDGSQTIPVELKSSFRPDWGLTDGGKAYNIGVAQVLIRGNAKDYFQVHGVKELSSITKIAEQVTVSGVGVGTYSTDVDLDFTGTAITAYTAVAGGTSVALTPIDGGVPANTGVVLKANGGASALVPVATTTATLETNEMLPNVARAQVALAGSNGKTNYILSNEAAGVGFYLAAENGAYLPAHRAYLSTTTTGNAPFLGFDGEGTTGIGATLNDNGEMINDKVYDLSGRRVAQPTKGIYIINGKKVVVK